MILPRMMGLDLALTVIGPPLGCSSTAVNRKHAILSFLSFVAATGLLCFRPPGIFCLLSFFSRRIRRSSKLYDQIYQHYITALQLRI